MEKIYTYHNHLRQRLDTSVRLDVERALKVIEDGGYVKVWDAGSENAEKCLDTMVTAEEIENEAQIGERAHWFRNAPPTPEAEWDIRKLSLSPLNPARIIGDLMFKHEMVPNIEDLILLGKHADERVELPKPEYGLSAEQIINETPIDGNRKTAVACGKPSVAAVPPIGFFALGAAMKDGEGKYGRFNWRSTGSTSSVFFDAMMRHLLAWWEGEDHASDSGVHHLGHLQAGAAILLDSELHGVLNDDRDEYSGIGINEIMSVVMKKKSSTN